MNKRMLLATIAVFITWSILDFIIHGVLLQSTYEATASLWRPEEEIKFLFAYAITFASNIFFVCTYGHLVTEKSLASGIKFGVGIGLAAGILLGLGSYPYMPIPLMLAISWFVATLVQFIAAGAITGAIVKS